MAWNRRALVTAALALPLAACVKQAAPDPAEIRETAPPWPAPRDAVSYIDYARLPRLPLDASDDPHVLTLEVSLAGQQVEVPAYVGVDRLRAVQAPCHTHDASGTVWIEVRGGTDVTLGQFFDVLGGTADGDLPRRRLRHGLGDCRWPHRLSPRDLRLRDVGHVVVRASAAS